MYHILICDICEIPHRSNTNFNPKEISVLVRNLQETKLQIRRNLLAQKPQETERTHLRCITVWYFLDNITLNKKKKKKKKMIVFDVSRLHGKFRKRGKKKKEIGKKITRKKRINVMITFFVFFFFFLSRFVSQHRRTLRDMEKSIKI